MQNNILVIILVVIIGVLSGISLLFGIGNAVSISVGPMIGQMGEISSTQKNILSKIDQGNAKGDTSTRLAAIEQRLISIENVLKGPGPGPQAPQPQAEDFNKVYEIPVGESPILGKKDAAITIMEFTDLQCPYCARFHPPLLEVLKAYPNDVRVVLKNFPLSFHPNARPAAKLAMAAEGQGKYYEMVDSLLENGADVSEAKIKDYAKKIGLNYNKLMDDYKKKDAQWEERVNADLALGGQVDVNGTPTFFINGKKTMSRDLNGFKAEIDQILGQKK